MNNRSKHIEIPLIKNIETIKRIENKEFKDLISFILII